MSSSLVPRSLGWSLVILHVEDTFTGGLDGVSYASRYKWKNRSHQKLQQERDYYEETTTSECVCISAVGLHEDDDGAMR